MNAAVNDLVATAMRMANQGANGGIREDIGGPVRRVVAMALKMGGINTPGSGRRSHPTPSRSRPSRGRGHRLDDDDEDDDDDDEDDFSDEDSSDSLDSEFDSDSDSEDEDEDEDGNDTHAAGQRLGGDVRPRTAEVQPSKKASKGKSKAPSGDSSRTNSNSQPAAKSTNANRKPAAKNTGHQNDPPAYKPALRRQETSRNIKIESDDDDDDDDDYDDDDDDDDEVLPDYESNAKPAPMKSSGYKRPHVGDQPNAHPGRPKAQANKPVGKKYRSNKAPEHDDLYGKKRT